MAFTFLRHILVGLALALGPWNLIQVNQGRLRATGVAAAFLVFVLIALGRLLPVALRYLPFFADKSRAATSTCLCETAKLVLFHQNQSNRHIVSTAGGTELPPGTFISPDQPVLGRVYSHEQPGFTTIPLYTCTQNGWRTSTSRGCQAGDDGYLEGWILPPGTPGAAAREDLLDLIYCKNDSDGDEFATVTHCGNVKPGKVATLGYILKP